MKYLQSAYLWYTAELSMLYKNNNKQTKSQTQQQTKHQTQQHQQKALLGQYK